MCEMELLLGDVRDELTALCVTGFTVGLLPASSGCRSAVSGTVLSSLTRPSTCQWRVSIGNLWHGTLIINPSFYLPVAGVDQQSLAPYSHH